MPLIDKSIEVADDVGDVYRRWTMVEHYPSFMTAIGSVTRVADDRLLWMATVEGVTYRWLTDFIALPDELRIEWQALDVRENAEVRLEKLPGDHTRLTYEIEYDPDAWPGDALAITNWMALRVPDGLARFKELVEGKAAA